ncbi:MAG: C40 family peptidase [Clostridiales bacterium]|nr:C40 family peptidase [Clostridiales bacterium]MBR4948656.1 C40 family peptidase [Clostridiales bacterium]
MKKVVLKHNRKQHIVAIATGFFVAVPVFCLPIGVREDMTPAMLVSRAYGTVYGTSNVESGEVVIEDWALVSSADELISADVGYDASYDSYEVEDTDPTEYVEVCAPASYSDVEKFTIYQQYDSDNLPIELLDPQCFAPDDTTYYVRAKQSILKEDPEMDSYTITSLHLGQEVTRIGVGDTWSKIRTEDDKEGYVLTNSIQDTMLSIEIDRTVWVDTSALIIRAEPSTSSEEKTTVYKNTKLYCSAIVGDKWYKVTTTGGTTGYVYKSYTTTNPPPTPTPTPTPRPRSSSSSGGGGSQSYGNVRSLPVITGKNGESIVSIAESMLGVPYVFAGSSSSGIDCSGLVMYCYAQIGVSLPHGATQIWLHSGVSVPRSDIKPGDVVCYDYGSYCGHVAIYVGDGQVIHASSSRGRVCYGNVDMMSIKAIKRIIQ